MIPKLSGSSKYIRVQINFKLNKKPYDYDINNIHEQINQEVTCERKKHVQEKHTGFNNFTMEYK